MKSCLKSFNSYSWLIECKLGTEETVKPPFLDGFVINYPLYFVPDAASRGKGGIY